MSEVGSSTHLVEHIVEGIGQQLDVFAVEWRDDRRFQATAHQPHHLVTGTFGSDDGLDSVGLDGQRRHQLLELNRRVDGSCGLLFEQRIEPVVTGDQTEAHGGRLDRVGKVFEKDKLEHRPSALVDLDTGRVSVPEQLEHFAGVGMASADLLGKQHLAVDNDVEHALGTGDQAKLGNDVLVVVE